NDWQRRMISEWANRCKNPYYLYTANINELSAVLKFLEKWELYSRAESGSSPLDDNEPIDESGTKSDSANNPRISAFHRPDHPSLFKACMQKRYYNLLHKALCSLLEEGYIKYENIEALSYDFYQRNHIGYISTQFWLQEKKSKFVLPEGVQMLVFIPYYFGFIRPEDFEAWRRRDVVIFIKAPDEIIEEL
ncbi:MAG TPA: hypothetical protein DCL49_08850, partial [Candidatus Omnitrophica bacterium]|nr:hypothetical protein [Candidatus Omnitrophota bacterium]